MAMSHDNHGWDDDEETIINFTPKQRAPQVKGAEATPLPVTESEHGRGPDIGAAGIDLGASGMDVPQVPPLMSMEAPLLAMHGLHAGMETPPASGLYGTQAPQSRFTAAHNNAAPAHEVSTSGQDPYLTFSGMQDALPPARKTGEVPTLPPL